MEHVQGQDIFHSGDIFCETRQARKRVAKVNKITHTGNFKSSKENTRFARGEGLLHILHAGSNYTIHHSGCAYTFLTCYLG